MTLEEYHNSSEPTPGTSVIMVSDHSSIPPGLDDPDTKSGFSCMVMDLYNGAKTGTISKGEIQPISTIVISSNISPIEEER